MIATYDFYQTEYFGKLLSAEEFPKCATKADDFLRLLTYNQYCSPNLSAHQLQMVKLCECAIADLYFQLKTGALKNSSFSKETVGSHSVTYRDPSDIALIFSVEVQKAGYRYLLTTGLLYRGAILKFKL